MDPVRPVLNFNDYFNMGKREISILGYEKKGGLTGWKV